MCIRRLLLRLKSGRSKQRLPSSEHLKLGTQGEQLAASYLTQRGHKVLARDFRCNAGQIDLVTVHGETVIFVEVKTRRSAAEIDRLPVSLAQQARIGRAARVFLSRKKLQDRPVRFDVVLVTCTGGEDPRIEAVEGAFTPGSG